MKDRDQQERREDSDERDDASETRSGKAGSPS
jgi:hypothetical protein